MPLKRQSDVGGVPELRQNAQYTSASFGTNETHALKEAVVKRLAAYLRAPYEGAQQRQYLHFCTSKASKLRT